MSNWEPKLGDQVKLKNKIASSAPVGSEGRIVKVWKNTIVNGVNHPYSYLVKCLGYPEFVTESINLESTSHENWCDVYDFDSDIQLGSYKPCNCKISKCGCIAPYVSTITGYIQPPPCQLEINHKINNHSSVSGNVRWEWSVDVFIPGMDSSKIRMLVKLSIDDS